MDDQFTAMEPVERLRDHFMLIIVAILVGAFIGFLLGAIAIYQEIMHQGISGYRTTDSITTSQLKVAPVNPRDYPVLVGGLQGSSPVLQP